MTNFKKISKKMHELLKQGRHEERNQLVPIWRKVFKEHDFGFEVGEVVKYHFSIHTIRTGAILAIDEDWQITFSDCIVPATLVSHLEDMPIKIEQLTLFE
ncbi:hypothetical protein [Pseudobacillus badius]|uniref:hypothetical protein n=1 Tax=Bacillus badius TaxID=1455 RepID=UPI003D3478BF